MADTSPRWERLAWRAMQHADLMLRQLRQSLRLDLNPKRSVRLTEEQARCPHPRRDHRRGGNRYGSYTHCTKCQLRISFTSAEERDKMKLKNKTSTSTSTPPTTSRANPKAAPSGSKPTPPPATATPAQEELLSAVLKNQQRQTDIISNNLEQVVRQQQELTGALTLSMNHLLALATSSSSAPPAPDQATAAVAPAPAVPAPAAAIPEQIDLTMNGSDSDLEYVS